MTTQEMLERILASAQRRTPPADDTAAQQADTMARANLGESSGIQAPSMEIIEGAGRALAESWMGMTEGDRRRAQERVRRDNPTLAAVARQHWDTAQAAMGSLRVEEFGLSTTPYGVQETIRGTGTPQITNATNYSVQPLPQLPVEPGRSINSILDQVGRGVVSRQTALDSVGIPSNAYSMDLLEQRSLANADELLGTQRHANAAQGIASPIGRGIAARDLTPSRGWRVSNAPEPIVFSLRIPSTPDDMFGMFSRNERQEVVSLYGIRVKIVGATVTSEEDSNVDVHILDQARQPICDMTNYLVEAYRVFREVLRGVVGVPMSALQAAAANPRPALVGARAISAPDSMDVPRLLRELAAAGITQEEVQQIVADRGVQGLVERMDEQVAKRDAPAPHMRIGRKVVVL